MKRILFVFVCFGFLNSSVTKAQFSGKKLTFEQSDKSNFVFMEVNTSDDQLTFTYRHVSALVATVLIKTPSKTLPEEVYVFNNPRIAPESLTTDLGKTKIYPSRYSIYNRETAASIDWKIAEIPPEMSVRKRPGWVMWDSNKNYYFGEKISFKTRELRIFRDAQNKTVAEVSIRKKSSGKVWTFEFLEDKVSPYVLIAQALALEARQEELKTLRYIAAGGVVASLAIIGGLAYASHMGQEAGHVVDLGRQILDLTRDGGPAAVAGVAEVQIRHINETTMTKMAQRDRVGLQHEFNEISRLIAHKNVTNRVADLRRILQLTTLVAEIRAPLQPGNDDAAILQVQNDLNILRQEVADGGADRDYRSQVRTELSQLQQGLRDLQNLGEGGHRFNGGQIAEIINGIIANFSPAIQAAIGQAVAQGFEANRLAQLPIPDQDDQIEERPSPEPVSPSARVDDE